MTEPVTSASQKKREVRTVLIHLNVEVRVDADATDDQAIACAIESVTDDAFRHLETAVAEVVDSRPAESIPCMCGATHGRTQNIGDGLPRCADCGCY